MIKYYCDICGKEITKEKPSERPTGTFGGYKNKRIYFEVTFGVNAKWNEGHFHKRCLVNKIAEYYVNSTEEP